MNECIFEYLPIIKGNNYVAHIDMTKPERGLYLCRAIHDISTCTRCEEGLPLSQDTQGRLLHRTPAFDFECLTTKRAIKQAATKETMSKSRIKRETIQKDNKKRT